MRKALRLAVVIIAVAGLAACGSHPSEAACKTAMKAEFAAAVTSGAQGTEPAACKGLPTSELVKLARQVLAGQ